ncbi:LacI family transcriptional regulator [Marinithermofilum abyssi]|uniref:LacI family transcriptional regulator n=1 Tax=Marinithermofilum abyssi TaxID=1571185 RepID=A0A8J2VF32_9BACL|nr:LacI family DNA-binding transcriptional regulator [Marinithermofilum abyssi]GGE15630.1 LacI family transcriptional regulator [Marinithermofilum abyssi]
MSSIKEIAKKAGVSVSTVSRALNNYTDVNQNTRKKIIQIAQELNYFPSAVARSLVTKRSYTIGLFFGDQVNSGFDHPFFLEVLSAVRKVAGDAGYDLLIFTNLHKKKATYTTLCRERGVDGLFLILTGDGKRKNEQLIELQESGIPCVAIDLPLDGERCSYVESNNFLGAKKAVSYLIKLGHRKIALIGGDEVGKVSFDRLNGYRAALIEAGLEYDPQLVRYGCYSADQAKEATEALVSENRDVTAILAVSDVMAIGAIQRLTELGWSVPDDISVVGFDDIREASTNKPSLTTVRQCKYEMGSEAIRLLMKTIEDVSYRPSPVVIPCELIVRDSTAPPRFQK